MPAREVERVADARPIHLTLACHVGAGHGAFEQDACEWAAQIRAGDEGLREVLDKRVAAGPMYDGFARRVFEMLDGRKRAVLRG
jgi:hypothetical protein